MAQRIGIGFIDGNAHFIAYAESDMGIRVIFIERNRNTKTQMIAGMDRGCISENINRNIPDCIATEYDFIITGSNF